MAELLLLIVLAFILCSLIPTTPLLTLDIMISVSNFQLATNKQTNYI